MNNDHFPYIPFTVFFVMLLAYVLASGYTFAGRMTPEQYDKFLDPLVGVWQVRVHRWLAYWFTVLPTIMLIMLTSVSWHVWGVRVIWGVKWTIDVAIIALVIVHRFRRG